MSNKLTYRTQFTKHDSDVELTLEPGLTLTEALHKANVPVVLEHNVHVTVDGEFIDHSLWDTKTLENDSQMRVTLIPSGGDNSSTLRMVAAIGITVFAGWAAGTVVGNAAWASATGATFWGGMAINIGITVLGVLLLNALFPPPDLPGTGEAGSGSPALSATAGNRLRPNAPIPRVYGHMKMWPPLGAQPFTIAEAGEQYLYQLFDFGYGPLQLSELKIGDTLISEYNEVEYYEHTSITGPEDLVWFTNDIETETVNANMEDLDINIRTSKPTMKYIQLDIVFPAGLIAYSSEGADNAEYVDWKINIKNELGTYITIANFFLTEDSPSDVTYSGLTSSGNDRLFRYTALRDTGFTVTLTLNFATQDNIDFVTVELTRTDSSQTGVSQINSTTYSAIRTFKEDNSINSFRIIAEKTNELSNPENFLPWASVNTDVYANVATNPSGEMTADKLVPDTVNSIHRISEYNTSIQANRNITFSCYVKQAELTLCTIQITNSTGVIANSYVNLASLEVTQAVGTSGIEISGNGYLRLWCTAYTTVSGNTCYIYPGITGFPIFTGDGASGLYVWGAMLNEGELSVYNTGPTIKRVEHTMVELRIRATDQLSGSIDTFNAMTDSLLRSWDGTQFVDIYTSNPAWVYADLLTGYVNQRPKSNSRMYWDKLKSWADSNDEIVYLTDENGQQLPGETNHTCNFIFDYSETLLNIIKSVAAVGKATFDIRDDYYSVIYDELKSVKTQLFTNYNSSGFSSSRIYINIPDAIKVSFVDPDSGWQLRESIVYNDGFDINTAKVFEEIESPMTTSHTEAWRLGRYWLKQAVLRQETITLNVDLDWLECSRGDLVGVQMDVMKAGGTVTRVCHCGLGVSGTEVTVESDPTLNGNNVEYFELRPKNGEIVFGHVAFYHASDPYKIDLGITGANVGDLIVLNSIGQQSYDMLVKQISTNSDLSAIVTLIEYAPELFDPESDLIPVYNPSLSSGSNPSFIPLPLQYLTAQQILTYANGLPFLSIQLDWIPDIGYSPSLYRVYRQNLSTSEWVFVGSTSETYFPWKEDILAVDNPIIGNQQVFSVVAVSNDGGYLPPASGKQTSITPTGDNTAPDILDYFVVEDTAEHLRRFWWEYQQVSEPIDFAGVLMRYTRGIDNWSSSTPLHDGILVQPPFEIRALPDGAQTILLKTVDTSGNLSAGVIKIVFALGDRILENIVITEDLSATSTWPGITFSGSSIIDVNDDLTADPSTTGLMWDPVSTVPMWNTDTDLMWTSSYQGFKYVDTLTTTENGINNIIWTGQGEFIFYYYVGTWPTSFIQTENLIGYPEQFDDAYWTKVNMVITQNDITSPDGTITAEKISPSSDVGVTSYIHDTVSTVSVGTSTWSIYVKSGEYTKCSIVMWNSTDGERSSRTSFNLSLGTVYSGPGAIESVGDEWYRCSVSAVNTVGTEIPHVYVLDDTWSSTFTGNDSDGLYVWGAMLSEGSLIDYTPLSSLIYTGAGQGLIPYTSPIFLDADDYGLIIECPNTVEISEIATLDWVVDVLDINELFEDYSLTTSTAGPNSGMVITLAKTYTAVTNVGYTSQGGTVAVIDTLAKGTTTIEVAAWSDTARTTRVAATVDIRVQGY